MVNLRTLINRRWDLITISSRSLTVFEGKIVVTALTKLVPVFFSKLYLRFFFDRYFFKWWFFKVCENHLNHLYHDRNKNVSVKSLSLICITSNLTTIYSPKRFMEDLAVITALNHSGSFGENFVMFKEKR